MLAIQAKQNMAVRFQNNRLDRGNVLIHKSYTCKLETCLVW
jgi:hypothetical protein